MKSHELKKMKDEKIVEGYPASEGHNGMFKVRTSQIHSGHSGVEKQEWTVREDIRIRPVRALHPPAQGHSCS